MLETETATVAAVAESDRPGADHETEGSTQSVEHEAQRAKRLRELRGHILSARRGASALFTSNAARLQHVIVLLLKSLVAAHLAIDPSIMLLLLEDGAGDGDELLERDVDELLLEELDPQERRRRLAADRQAAFRRGLPVTEWRARQEGTVTLDRNAPSRSERYDQRYAERYGRRAHGGARPGFTASFCDSSSPPAEASLPLASSAPTSSPSSPLDLQSDHLAGDHSRARAPEPYSDRPKQTSEQRAAHALVDACAEEHHAATGTWPAFAPSSKSKQPQQPHAKHNVFDGCLRGLTRAVELAPELPMAERFKLVRRAYGAHVRQRLPWKAWRDNARQYVRLANDARLHELEEARKAAAEADKRATRQRGDKEPTPLSNLRPIFERAERAAGGAASR